MSSTNTYKKLIEYAAFVSKHDVLVTEDGKEVLNWKANKSIVISPLFWRGDRYDRCGRCCHDFDMCWTDEGLKRIYSATPDEYKAFGIDYSIHENLKKNLQTVVVKVNGVDRNVYVDKPPLSAKKQAKCDHLVFDELGLSCCNIHIVRSLTCMMPHNVLRITGEGKPNSVVHLSKQSYGRNWAIGCPITYHEGKPENNFNYEEFISRDVEQLKILKAVADDLGIETWVPEILKVFEDLDPMLREGRVPTYQIPIYQTNQVTPHQTRIVNKLVHREDKKELPKNGCVQIALFSVKRKEE